VSSPAPAEGGPHRGYRPAVGMMLARAGRIFLGKRHGPLLDAWQMPQGGIEPGETPERAAWRELAEEVGTRKAELLAESRRWYAYDLPAELQPHSWDGRHRGQSQRWFLFRFTGSDADIDIGSVAEPEFRAWRWARPATVLQLAITFKRPVYEAVLEEFRDLLEAG
jgi:putative (di)nucleoside polyphosphate hydrolase